MSYTGNLEMPEYPEEEDNPPGWIDPYTAAIIRNGARDRNTGVTRDPSGTLHHWL